MERLPNFFNVKIAAVPDHWKSAIIVSVCKQSSSKNEFKNYRGLVSQIHLGRCLAKFHWWKIKEQRNLWGLQYSFMSGRGCAKQNVALLLVTKD